MLQQQPQGEHAGVKVWLVGARADQAKAAFRHLGGQHALDEADTAGVLVY